MQQESLFLSYVRRTLKQWIGFQAAINEGMGGPYTKEKEEWLGTEIENYFERYDDVSVEDVEEYIEIMIEDEFDTSFEDGSLTEVSKKFCTAYKLSKENPNAEIFQDVYKRLEPALDMHRPASEVLSEEEVPCESMAELSVSENPEEESWTTVSKKNKKRK